MKEPYSAGLLNFDPYAKKQPVVGRIVAVLRGKLENRNLNIIEPRSRALKAGEIHELIMTDEREATCGKVVNRIAYVAFIEIVQAGVVVSKDQVRLGDGRRLGTLVGFDETHMPNHENIVIYSDQLMSGEELGLQIGESVIFYKEG